MKTTVSILLSASVAALGRWGYNEITFRAPDNGLAQPTVTLHAKDIVPDEVVNEILDRHGDLLTSVSRFDGTQIVENAPFLHYLIFDGFLVALGIVLFLCIQRFTAKTEKSAIVDERGTAPTDDSEA